MGCYSKYLAQKGIPYEWNLVTEALISSYKSSLHPEAFYKFLNNIYEMSLQKNNV